MALALPEVEAPLSEAIVIPPALKGDCHHSKLIELIPGFWVPQRVAEFFANPLLYMYRCEQEDEFNNYLNAISQAFIIIASLFGISLLLKGALTEYDADVPLPMRPLNIPSVLILPMIAGLIVSSGLFHLFRKPGYDHPDFFIPLPYRGDRAVTCVGVDPLAEPLPLTLFWRNLERVDTFTRDLVSVNNLQSYEGLFMDLMRAFIALRTWNRRRAAVVPFANSGRRTAVTFGSVEEAHNVSSMAYSFIS